tara:strand:- start:10321 stop:12513 length:2193 start_codon:yes stop_codon:yes gene_type:complete
MRLIHKHNLYLFKKNNYGFAIPQVLILGVGIAVAVSGLMAASILGLTGSRISRQELIAKASSYSGITTIRSLLNDGSENGLFHYLWLVDGNNNLFPNPSTQYWPDDEWCKGSDICLGRQKAPMCVPLQGWNEVLQDIGDLTDNDYVLIEGGLNTPTKDVNQAYKLISTKYTGTDQYGINSVLIEGMALSKDSRATASNKLRVNIKVHSDTTESGFGFLSIGENNSDKENSLFLGNLTITPEEGEEEPIGSIIWRRNLADDECEDIDFKTQAKGEESSLPAPGNGGIWVQPLGLPKQPRLSNVEDLEVVICTPNVIEQDPQKCSLTSENGENKVYRIHSLYVKGPGSKFEVSTTNDSKVILEIMGDIDISSGGIFCHKDGAEPCGSGQAENLTILFNQKTSVNANKMVCNRNEGDEGGGVQLLEEPEPEGFSEYQQAFDNNQLPGSSFLIDNTGDNYSGMFSSFVYGPKVTFISVRRPENKQGKHWVQFTNSEQNNSGMIVTSRSSYGLIKNTMSSNNQDKMVNIILTPNSHVIPYLNKVDLIDQAENEPSEIEIIGVGYKVNDLPSNSKLNPNSDKAFIIYNKENKNNPYYYLRTFDIETIDSNAGNSNSSVFSYPLGFAKMHPFSDTTNVDFPNGKDGLESDLAKDYLNAFGIDMQLVEDISINSIRNFSGAAWVKNLCFDSDGDKTWQFSKKFINGLSKWHGKDFNWGVRYYRGRSITLWDTLRNFKD